MWCKMSVVRDLSFFFIIFARDSSDATQWMQTIPVPSEASALTFFGYFFQKWFQSGQLT